MTDRTAALWANEVQRMCLVEAGDDVDAGLAAADFILSNHPPLEVVDVDAFFAHDIYNRRAQGILNRSLKAAKRLSADAKRDLTLALKDRSGAAVVKFVDKYRTQLAKLLTTSQLASVLEGAREVAEDVPVLATFHGAVPPPPSLEPKEASDLVDRLGALSGDARAAAVYELPPNQQTYVQQAIAAKEAGPVEPPRFTTPHIADDAEGVHFPTIDEAVKQLAEKNVMTRDRFDALDASAKAKAFTVANVSADETLTKIRDALSENVREGADYETFRKKVMDTVDQGTFMSEAHLETVFRTNVQSAFSDGQMTVLQHPLVRSGFPYSAYDSIHDDRVRPEHKHLDRLGIGGSNVYRTDDPVFQTFRPPWSYNCRCSWTPMTVRQAAEAGVEEAKKWLDTGVEPEEKAFVQMPDFAPPPGFQRSVSSAPLSVQLSLQSMIALSTDAEGHQHKGKGEGGGQFTSSGNGSETQKSKIEGSHPKRATDKTPRLNLSSNERQFWSRKTPKDIHSLVIDPGSAVSPVETPTHNIFTGDSQYSTAAARAREAISAALEERLGTPDKSSLSVAKYFLTSNGRQIRVSDHGVVYAFEDTGITIAPGAPLISNIKIPKNYWIDPDAIAELAIAENEKLAPVDIEGFNQRRQDSHNYSDWDTKSRNLADKEWGELEPKLTAMSLKDLAQFAKSNGVTPAKSKSSTLIRLRDYWGSSDHREQLSKKHGLKKPERKYSGGTYSLGDYVFAFDPSEKRDSTGVQLAVGEDDYPRDKSNRFVDKFALAEATRDQKAATDLRESLPEDQRWKFDRAVAQLQASGSISHPKEPPGLAVDKDGIVVDPQWAEYDKRSTAYEEWSERDRGRAGWLKDLLSFKDALRQDKPLASAYRAIAATAELDAIGETRDAVDAALTKYREYLDDLSSQFESIGATEAEERAAARLRRIAEVELAGLVERYVHRKKTSAGAEAVAESLDALLDALQSAFTKTSAVYEEVAEQVHKRIEDDEACDPQVEEPVEPEASIDAAYSNEQDDTDERVDLIAKILVALFGDGAEDAAKSLSEPEGGVSAALAVGNPKVKRRYGRRPGPGWTPGGTSSKGQQIWIWGAAQGGGAAAQPAPQQPAQQQQQPAPQQPAAPQPQPQPAQAAPPALRAGGQRARAASIAAYNSAMATLNAGRQLLHQDKLALSKKLTNMPMPMLRSLHNALGHMIHQSVTGKLLVQSVKIILTNSNIPITPTPQTPVAQPTPQVTQATPPTQPIRTPFDNMRNAAPSLHSTIPFKDETVWETGKPQQGVVLNGVPFEPAPPKFWEKVKDVDVKEPKPLRPIQRAGVLIQEPDGRIWIVQPTNGFGGRNHTLPGGGVEKGLTVQQNALKEVWEETGLQVEITGFVGDFEDENNGNNGRLYLAKRVGGAPWDAKVESFIKSNKTGKPAAESETVSLVTPEKAAQLLHKKDDLAQLIAVHPIDYKLGPGSERLSRLIKALKPAAQQYSGTGKGGNSTLHAIQEMRGFNAKPAAVVPKADMDKLVAKGDHIELLRGISSHGSLKGTDMAEAFRTGDHYPGHGIFGDGTYADSNKGYKNVATAGRYGSGSGAGMLRMALPKAAKIIKQSDLDKILASRRVPDGYSGASDSYRGLHAALAGYDAIHVDTGDYSGYGKGFYVVLNRGVLVVQKEDAKGHSIK